MKPFNNLPCINMAAVTRLHQPSSHCLKHAFIWELYQQAYLGRWWRVKQFLRKMTYPNNGVGLLFCFVLFLKKYVFPLIKCRCQFWFNSLQSHQRYLSKANKEDTLRTITLRSRVCMCPQDNWVYIWCIWYIWYICSSSILNFHLYFSS